MRVIIDETDKHNLYRVALRQVCKLYNIPNWEYETNQTLYDLIKSKKYSIFTDLKKYLKALDNWFAFYARIKQIEDKSGVEYDLTIEEQKELGELIRKRQKTLSVLQKKFDTLTFEQFKKSHESGGIDL